MLCRKYGQWHFAKFWNENDYSYRQRGHFRGVIFLHFEMLCRKYGHSICKINKFQLLSAQTDYFAANLELKWSLESLADHFRWDFAFINALPRCGQWHLQNLFEMTTRKCSKSFRRENFAFLKCSAINMVVALAKFRVDPFWRLCSKRAAVLDLNCQGCAWRWIIRRRNNRNVYY